jgi:hypothetical protein
LKELTNVTYFVSEIGGSFRPTVDKYAIKDSEGGQKGKMKMEGHTRNSQPNSNIGLRLPQKHKITKRTHFDFFVGYYPSTTCNNHYPTALQKRTHFLALPIVFNGPVAVRQWSQQTVPSRA